MTAFYKALKIMATISLVEKNPVWSGKNQGGGNSGAAGYTLLELMVVMILLSLAASMVFVNLGASVGKRKDKAFMEQLNALILTARQTAVLRHRPVALKISSSQALCWVDLDNGPRELEVPEHIQMDGREITRLDDDVHAFIFYPDGSSSGGILYLSTDGVFLTGFMVDRFTGVVSIEKDGP